MEKFDYKFIDVLNYDCMPHDWQSRIYALADREAVHVKKEGKGVGSLEEEETAGLDYHVVSGEAIKEYAGTKFLVELYDALLPEVRKATGFKIEPWAYPKSTININILSGTDKRYELHTDRRPFTFLLFVNTLVEQDGGQLCFCGENGQENFVIQPRAGIGILFNGMETPHMVKSLRRKVERVTVPMEFCAHGYHADTEDGDDYLYRGK